MKNSRNTGGRPSGDGRNSLPPSDSGQGKWLGIPDLEGGPEDGSEEIWGLIKFFRHFDSLGSQVQHEICNHLNVHREYKDSLERFLKLPESVQTEQVGRAVKAFVQTMPFANAIGVNMFTTALASHSDITGSEVFRTMINKLNEETIEDQLEDLDDE